MEEKNLYSMWVYQYVGEHIEYAGACVVIFSMRKFAEHPNAPHLHIIFTSYLVNSHRTFHSFSHKNTYKQLGTRTNIPEEKNKPNLSELHFSVRSTIYSIHLFDSIDLVMVSIIAIIYSYSI